MNQNEEDQVFGFAVPLARGAEVFEITHQGQTLFRKRASANSPTVELLSPNGGEVIGGDTMTVTWQADDGDGDVLLFDVQYSSDNGRTWKLLATEVLSTTITLDMETIAGSDGFGLVRAVGNDGLNSGHDSSDCRFTVGKKPPRMRITSHSDGGLHAPRVAAECRGHGLLSLHQLLDSYHRFCTSAPTGGASARGPVVGWPTGTTPLIFNENFSGTAKAPTSIRRSLTSRT